jgi:cytochrome c2
MQIWPWLLLAVAAVSPAMGATRSLLLGDAERGQALFRSLNCIACHSVNGVGGKKAPDIGQGRDRGFDPYRLAGLMWNHAPRMWGAMASQGVAKPELDEQQSADLFAFFYAASYFENPGNTRRGRQLFLLRRCGECHGAVYAVHAGIKPVAEWDSPWDPIALAQRMWNHSGDMARALDKSAVPYPMFTAQELTDVLAWLRSLRPRAEPAAFAPASPESGRTLIESKGCAGCHRGSLALENHRTRYGLTDFAAAMWNHPFRTGYRQTPLGEEEMRRLVGYLVATQFFEERGNPENGGRLFAKKRCSLCHDNPSSGAPGRSAMSGRTNSFGMVAALWKHGPAMLLSMRQRNVPWPRFTGAEMADISAYLYGLELRRRTSP